MATTSPSGIKTRSPNYPAIALPEAISRTRKIFDSQQRYPASRDVLVKLMGYGSLNGASKTVLSALSKYGLLEGRGEELRVSELGQDIVLHRKGDSEYSAALKEAAFAPAFFRELHDQYPSGLPSDHAVRATLIKRGFNSKAIDTAVRAFRETIDFMEAETNGFEEVPSGETDEGLSKETEWKASSARSKGQAIDREGHRTVHLPLSLTEWATLQAPFPLTENAWNQLVAVLEAMKPALVEASSSKIEVGEGEPPSDHGEPIL